MTDILLIGSKEKTESVKLDELARLAIDGLGLVPGQELVVTAPVEAIALVRKIAGHAYKAGASIVTPIFTDDENIRSRFRYALDESFDRSPGWLFQGMATAFRSGAARLAIVGEDPTLLQSEDPNKVARANRSRSESYRAIRELTSGFFMNWTIVPCATLGWAKAVFPNDPDQIAMGKLWDVIFFITRVQQSDPVTAWSKHMKGLQARASALNQKRYTSLHFRGPGTDLQVGLADDHTWNGGFARAKNGTICCANIPSEEIFTAPHKNRVEGYVSSTKPLPYHGTLIEDISICFANGEAVRSEARVGDELLKRIMSIDSGSCRLGEVALVPYSSPISQTGLLFYNTLLDENAASHIALGQGFAKSISGGDDLPGEELEAKGLNQSLIHLDCMIGSSEVDVDGLTSTGTSEPVMRHGEWV